MNLEAAVHAAAERRKASIGAAFRPISSTAEQFQMGDCVACELFWRDKALASYGRLNCVF